MSANQNVQEQEQQATKDVPVLTVDESQSVEERLTDNVVQNVLPARYLTKDETGEINETTDEMFRRVAENVAKPEYELGDPETADKRFAEYSEEFYRQMSQQRFMPNSPTLMNAGARLGQLSACFVNSPKDDLEDIADTEKEWTLVQKTGGGMGGSFSDLRPAGTLISTTKGTSSGPVSFMLKFNLVAGVIKQGGVRRGAQMAELRADHPDIGRFAVCKRNEGDFDNFNISVAVTDEFIEAVKNDETYTLYSPSSDFTEPFEIVGATRDFYSPERQHETERTVKSNLWRDYADDISAWDWENEETVSFRAKWEDEFTAAAENNKFADGEKMELPARFIWDLILDGAWRNGEPGLFHLDETNRKHSFDVESGEDSKYSIKATNPSLVAGTPVLTDDGVKKIEQLEDTTFKTRSLSGNWAAASCWKSGTNEELYEITTNTGYTYEATPEHEWPVINDGSLSKKRSDELSEGDWIPLTKTDSLEYGEDGEYSDGLIIGWLYGDGSITARTEDNRADFQYGFTVSQADKDAGMLDFLVNKLEEITGTTYNPTKRNRGGEDWYEIHACNEDIVAYMDSFDVTEKSGGVPDCIWNTASEEFRMGFIDGLFSADGHVDTSNERVTLVSSRSQIAEDVVSLLSFYGIKAQRSESVSELGEEEYERHDVTISNTPALRFRELFRLSHDEKQSSLEELSAQSYETVKSSSVKISSVENSDRTADVWDISVLDKSHTFPIAGITTGNCAEQPLMEYEACNLGHVNLSLILEDGAPTFDEWEAEQDYDYQTTKAAAYDYFEEAVNFDEFDKTIETGTRFLDNVVTESDFPLEKIQERVTEMRKIGLGVMGWAQLLYQMGLRYGEDESLQMARVVMNYIDRKATETSHELAQERGVFEAWDDSKYASPQDNAEWFNSHAYQLAEDWEDGYAMRNHNVTTVAPTGTTSMIGDTSGGIEPVYNVANYKNVGDDIQGDDMLVQFDKVFLQTLEANEADLDGTVEDVKKQAQDLMESGDFDGVRDLDVPQWMKETFVTTNDLTAREHGLMQRAFQEGVDSGISKTVNLPKESTHADVHDAYMLAVDDDELGAVIKGLTVYRDQSRGEQVLTTQKHSDKELEQYREALEESGYIVREEE